MKRSSGERVGRRGLAVHPVGQSDVGGAGGLAVDRELDGGLAALGGGEADLSEEVADIEAHASDALAALVHGLNDEAGVADGVAVADEGAAEEALSELAVDGDSGLAGGGEGEEVDDAADGLGAKEDAPAALDDLDGADALDRGGVVGVGLAVGVDGDGDAVFEEEDSAAAGGVEAANTDVEAEAGALFLAHTDAGDAAGELSHGVGLGAGDVLAPMMAPEPGIFWRALPRRWSR
ncbi:MAG: hypothetical protein R3F14_13595 [Polyangiaceae bacterium]